MIVKPSMNVFTVGMDEKGPVKTPLESPPSPPPSYSAKQISQEMGSPIIIKKKSSFKTPLIWLLAVFLIAFFTLTLSEIAYNRQRDERFFKLRWAELKHRMGFDKQNYNNEGSIFNSLRRSNEFGERIIPINNSPWRNDRDLKVEETSTTTSTTTTTKAAPIATESKDTKLSDSEESSSELGNDPRLQFLKNILQNIKQHAEDMGMEGTMQVSVIRVDPIEYNKEKNNKINIDHDSFEDNSIDKPIFEPPHISTFSEDNKPFFQTWNRPQPQFMNNFQSSEEDDKSNEVNFFNDVQKRRFGQIVQDIIARRIQQAALFNAIARQQQLAAQMDQQNTFYNRQSFYDNNQQPQFIPFQQPTPFIGQQQPQVQWQQPQWQQQPQQQPQQQWQQSQPVFFQPQQQFQQPQQPIPDVQNLPKINMNEDMSDQQPSDAVWNKQITEVKTPELPPNQIKKVSNGEGKLLNKGENVELNKPQQINQNDIFPVRVAVANDDPIETIHNDIPIFQRALFQVDEPIPQVASGSA
uniref:Uncharacterized protein n=1 Tax=Strongyloides stercoralis TaxID=6248 RepID=A0AAF5DK90_STRER